MSAVVVLLFFLLFKDGFAGSCKSRSFKENATVCVCDENYCDDLILLSNISSVAFYETSRDGNRFNSSVLKFSGSIQPGVPVFTLNNSKIYQFILGFGGAFTDATGINLESLSPALQEKLLKSYFSQNGLQYNMGRVPIASCDFSTRSYSYADTKGDFALKYFQLAKEDFLYKIPFIQKANALTDGKLLLFGSPWSAPWWMKTNGAMKGNGSLIGEPGDKYYQTWANYFVRFLKSYEEHNITFWGLTTQNEPTDGCVADFRFQAMCFPPEKQRDFLKLDLGPALLKAGFGLDKVKIMIMDDIRALLPKWVDVIMKDKEAAQYVSGIAFHWYLEDLNPHKILDVAHSKYSNLFFLATEACAGYSPFEFPKVDLGSWERAERYAHDIIQDLLNWSIGWIDWNLALNMEGGPNWVKNFVDSPIIVNAHSKEFYKQPTYYVLAHFSKFLPRGSYRIGLDLSQASFFDVKDFEIAAFQTPFNKSVVIALNRKDEDIVFAIHDIKRGYLKVKTKAHSIQSYVW